MIMVRNDYVHIDILVFTIKGGKTLPEHLHIIFAF